MTDQLINQEYNHTFLYVVKFENGNRYVGETKSMDVIKKRTMKSQWITKNGDISDIQWGPREYFDISEKTPLTLMLMKKYGMNTVRGGGYSEVEFSEVSKRELTNYLEHMNDCDEYVDFVEVYKKVKETNDKIGRLHALQRLDYHTMLRLRNDLMENEAFLNYSLDQKLTRSKKREIFGNVDVDFYDPKDLTQHRRRVLPRLN